MSETSKTSPSAGLQLGSVIGSGVGSIISSIGGLSSLGSKRWRRNQDWLLGKQYEYWQKQFDYESSYNSPLAQISRLRDAGLNPNLMYGSGMSSTGNVAMPPAVGGSAPSSAGVLSPASSLSTLAGLGQQLANIRYTDALTNKTQSETEAQENVNPYVSSFIQSRISNLDANTQTFLDTHNFFDLSKEVQLSILRNTSENWMKRNTELAYTIHNILPRQSAQLDAITTNYRASTLSLLKGLDVQDKQIENYSAQIGLAAAMAYNNYMQGKWTGLLGEQQIELLRNQSAYYLQLPSLMKYNTDVGFDIAAGYQGTTERGQNFGLAGSILSAGLSAYGMYHFLKPAVRPSIGFVKTAAKTSWLASRGLTLGRLVSTGLKTTGAGFVLSSLADMILSTPPSADTSIYGNGLTAPKEFRDSTIPLIK